MTGTVSTLLLQPVLAAFPPDERPRLFRSADLTNEIVSDRDARVSPTQFCVAWAELVRVTDREITLRLAESTPLGAFGVVEYLCRSAPTLGEALQQWVRYLNLLDDAVEVAIVDEEGGKCVRVVRESEAPAPPSHELCFALLTKQSREIGSREPSIVRVDFSHRCENPAAYEAWFGAPVRFGAPHDQLVFRALDFDIPLKSADANLLAVLARQAEMQAEAIEGEESLPFTAVVRRALREGLREDVSIEQVGRRIGMSARTVQRRLRDDGTTFQALREAVRHELASRYLEQDLSISEISFLLGFSQPSAFFRAFKRWTGMTPQERRAASV